MLLSPCYSVSRFVSQSRMSQVMGPALSNNAASNASSEIIHSLVPRLELNGSNWAAFKMRFRVAMDAADRWGHFTGSETRPVPKDPKKPTDDELTAGKAWDREDKIGQNLLLQRLPDITAMSIIDLSTAQECWARLVKEFTAKSVYAQNDLQQAFFDMRCPKNGDVRAFLQSLILKRQELAAAGAPVSDAEYQRTLLRGIPNDLARFASQLLVSSKVSGSSSTLDIDTLTMHICEEADRNRNRNGHGQQNHRSNRKEPDEALAVTTSGAGKSRHRKGNCHHCGKAGHWARECRKKAAEEATQGGQARQASLSTTARPETWPVGAANFVAADDIEGNGFWMAIEGEEPAHTISTDPDPFLGEEEEHVDFEADNESVPDDDSDDWLCEMEETAAAAITQESNSTAMRIKLFDLGATRHISPYWDDFMTYSLLTPPLLLNTANQQ